jgi:hypothetical protein
MLVTTAADTATILASDGTLHTVPYEALTYADMQLQARYHKFVRGKQYRRELVCRRCKEDMMVESDINEEERTWMLLMVCRCRALYGKIPLRDLA